MEAIDDDQQIFQDLKDALQELQSSLNLVDLINDQKNDRYIEFLVVKKGIVRLDIHKELNHQLPHFHIMFKQIHKASYAIESLEKLAGNMPKQFEKPIIDWAKKDMNKEKLKKARQLIKEGKTFTPIIL